MIKQALAAVGLAAGLSLAALPVAASAATNTCIDTTSCGGADLAYTGHGALSFAVLDPSSTINGGFGYNDERLTVEPSGATDGSQDFSLVTDTSAGLGQYGYGEDLIEYTPGGQHATGSELPMCVSVENYYPTVGGKVVQRWAAVLRWCGAMGNPEITYGLDQTADATSAPDPYQLFAPVEAPSASGNYLQFEDVGLNNSHLRHGFGGSDFVLDDKGYGGAGSQVLAYPNHFGLNQEVTVDGCTPPITGFNAKDFNCTAVVVAPSTP